MERYNEERRFIEANQRNPSRFYDGEKWLVHLLKRGRELMNAGVMKPGRVDAFTQ